MMRSHALQTLLLALGVAVGGCSSSRTATHSHQLTTQTEREIRAIGQRAVEGSGIVGLSIAVAINGGIVFSEGFGHADSDRTIPATSETIYDIASVGKHFTAAAILQLAEHGELSLDDRVRSFVPELPAHFPNATIEQLLRHTSGFVSGALDELNPPADYSRPRYGLELLSDVELQTGRTLFDEEETWVYSNAGYLVLGLVVEAASGMRYDRYIRTHVLGPLEPHDMLVCEYAELPRGSQRLRRSDDGVSPVPFIHMSAWSGQGSICTSAVDLLRWSNAINSGRIITRQSLIALRSPTSVKGTHATAKIPYGMAQRLGAIGGYHKVGHTGTFDGGSAALTYYPEASLEIAVTSNTFGGGTPHAHTIETAIAKLLLGVNDPDVQTQRVAMTVAQRRMIEGVYSDGQSLKASIDGDELVVVRNGKEIERLIHIGDMRFRNPDRPDVFEWFVLDGERAGWWVYSMSGNFLEVLRRTKP